MEPIQEPQKSKNSQQPQIVFLFCSIFVMFVIYFVINKQEQSTQNKEVQKTKNNNDTLSIASIIEQEKPVMTDSLKSIIYKNIVSRAKKEFKTKFDDMGNYYWVHDKNSPSGIMSSEVSLYMGLSKVGVWRRLRIHYFGDDWIFIHTYKFKIDDELIEYIPNNLKTDNDAGYVWETFDECPDDNTELENIIEKLAKAKTAKVRFLGNQYYRDKVITSKELKAIRHINSLYQESKNEFQQ